MCANRFDPTFLVGVMHVNREPWISIVRCRQIGTGSLPTNKKFEVLFFRSILNSLAYKISKFLESLRRTNGKRAAHPSSFMLKAEFESGISIKSGHLNIGSEKLNIGSIENNSLIFNSEEKTTTLFENYVGKTGLFRLASGNLSSSSDTLLEKRFLQSLEYV